MNEYESLLTTLLMTLARVHRSLARKSGNLRRERSDVLSAHCDLDIGETVLDEPQELPGEGFPGLHIEGYVDADMRDGSIVLWKLEIYRQDISWQVRRELRLNHDPVQRLPVVVCADSHDLAQSLPALVDELLALPVPEPREEM